MYIKFCLTVDYCDEFGNVRQEECTQEVRCPRLTEEEYNRLDTRVEVARRAGGEPVVHVLLLRGERS